MAAQLLAKALLSWQGLAQRAFGAVLAFRLRQSLVQCHLPSGFPAGQTGELHGKWVPEVISPLSASATTSEVPFHAAAEMGYCAT